MSASQLFTLGEYALFKGKGNELLVGCEIKDSFYPLRSEYDKLTYASIVLSSAEMAIQPEEPQTHLMILLMRTLSRLAYTDMNERAVTAAYLLHFSALVGYKPRLMHCVNCGRVIEEGEPAWLDSQAGGLMCKYCCSPQLSAMKLEADAVIWLRSVLKVGIEKTQDEPAVLPLLQLKRYVEGVMERQLPKLPEQISPL